MLSFLEEVTFKGVQNLDFKFEHFFLLLVFF